MPGIDPVSAVTSGIQTAIGVGQMIKGGIQTHKAKELAKNVVRPGYDISQNEKNNLSYATSDMQGLSDASKELYSVNNDRQFATGIDAILRGGGSTNNISDIYDTAQDNNANLIALNEEIRQKEAARYMAANDAMDEQLRNKWMVEQWGPYQDEKKMIADLAKQGQQNFSNGINSIGQAAGNFGASNMGRNDGITPGKGGLSATNNLGDSLGSAPAEIGSATPGQPAGGLQTSYYTDILKKYFQ